MGNQKCIFSIDVEDWFHILDLPSTPPMAQWSGFTSCVESNFRRLLELTQRHDRRVTCFFLGWVAERYPHLVREAHAAGHEIASHGYAHELVYHQSRQAFRDDIVRSKSLLEDLIGEPVLGYRAPGFSVTEETPWFFEELIAAGFQYDSSVFPTARGHGGMHFDSLGPCNVDTASGSITEFPISLAALAGKRACFFGGGYLRLAPLWLIRRMMGQVFAEDRPVCVYIHPREIDPHHPRLPMGLVRRFKTYVNLRGTYGKLDQILSHYEITTHADFLAAWRGSEGRQQFARQAA